MKSIIVLFSKNDIADKVVVTLKQNLFTNIQKVSDVHQAIRLMNRLKGGGVLVTGHPLGRVSLLKLLEIAPKWFNLLLLLPSNQLMSNEFTNYLQLSPPTSPQLLKKATHILLTDNLHKACCEKYGDDKAKKAKNLLMQQFLLSEKQAHRFLQKNAMENRVSINEYATYILKM